MTASYLGSNDRLQDMPRLIENIKSNQIPELKSVCDSTICSAVNAAHIFYGNQLPAPIKQLFENLINQISDAQTRLQIFFQTSQLKSAYLLAVQIDHMDFLKRIYKQAVKDKNDYVIKLCERRFMSSDNRSNKSNVSSN